MKFEFEIIFSNNLFVKYNIMACLWISNHSFSLVTVRMIKQRFTKLSLWASKYSTKSTILRNASGSQLNFRILSFTCSLYHQCLLRRDGWLFLTTLPTFHFEQELLEYYVHQRALHPDRIRQKIQRRSPCLQSFTKFYL